MSLVKNQPQSFVYTYHSVSLSEPHEESEEKTVVCDAVTLKFDHLKKKGGGGEGGDTVAVLVGLQLYFLALSSDGHVCLFASSLTPPPVKYPQLILNLGPVCVCLNFREPDLRIQ